MAKKIEGTEDLIDFRDIQERIDELCELFEIVEPEGVDELMDEIGDPNEEAEEFHELKELIRFKTEEAVDDSHFNYGETLIDDLYFTEYAETLAKDIYDIGSGWPFTHIDWEAAAEALKQDYKPVELFGSDYWYRS